MKQRVLNIESASNRIPLFDLALLKGFSADKPARSIREPKQPIKKIPEEKNPQNHPVAVNSKLLLAQQAPIFKGIADQVLQQLSAKSLLRSVTKGEEIIYHGEEVKFLYLILEGAVKVFRASPEAKDATLSMLKSGDTFMESAIFMQGPSPATVEALTATQLLLIPADTIKQQVAMDGPLRTNMLRGVALHYKNALQQIDCIVTKAAVDRLGYYLLKESIEQNIVSLNIELQSQKSMIASHLGMVPATFSRALKSLKTMGIDVSPDKNFKITLRERSSLCRFCDLDLAFNCGKYQSSTCNRFA